MTSGENGAVASEERDRQEGRGKSAGRRRSAERWLAAGLLTVVLHLAAFFLLRIPVPEGPEEIEQQARLAWIGQSPSNADSILGEQLLLFDNAPLFLPTTWNAGAAENVAAANRSPTGIFEGFPTRLTVAELKSPQVLKLLPDGIESPVEGIGLLHFNLFSAFGRSDSELRALDPRLAHIEVWAAFSGRKLGSRVVRRSALAEDSEWPDWEPFEVLVDVNAAGGQAPPLVVRGSGSGVVDAFFRSYIAQELRVDLSYGPGYYRLLVGP